MIPLGVLASALVAAPSGITDSFNRAGSTTTLGNTDTGQAWVYAGGAAVFGITGNQAYKVAPHNTHSVALVPVGVTDVSATATVATYGTVAYPGVVARGTPGTTGGYFLWLENATTVYVVRRTNAGVQTLLSGAIPATTAVGVPLRIVTAEEGAATRVTAYVNDVQAYTTLDYTAGRPLGTHAGLFFYAAGSGSTIDNFTCEAL